MEEHIEYIAPNRLALSEALNLSSEILKNLELNEIRLQNIALKASRLVLQRKVVKRQAKKPEMERHGNLSPTTATWEGEEENHACGNCN
jgi:hypothetical protein